MIVKLSQMITKFLDRNISIESDMIDIYQYGIEITLSSMLNIILVLLAAALTGNIFTGIVFLAVFISLRTFTGGYHATTYMRCNTVMIITFIIVKVMSEWLFVQSTTVKLFIVSICILPVILYAPVKNVHKELTDSQRKSNYIISIVSYIIIAAVSIVLLNCDIKYGSIIIATLTVISAMILIEIFMQRRGYHEC